MAYAKQLSADVIAKLAGPIGDLIGGHRIAASADAPPHLAESFEIFHLPIRDLQKAAQRGGGLARLIKSTRHWHHQIAVAGKPVGFARSLQPRRKKEDWSVQSVFVSPLASKVETAVQQIDAQRPDDKTEVRLVALPAYHMHFFLIEGPVQVKAKTKTKNTKASGKKKPVQAEVYVVDSPFSAPGLEPGRFYPEPQFLAGLLAVPPIRGLRVPAKRRSTKKTAPKPRRKVTQKTLAP